MPICNLTSIIQQRNHITHKNMILRVSLEPKVKKD